MEKEIQHYPSGEYSGNNQRFENKPPQTTVPLQLKADCPFCFGKSTAHLVEKEAGDNTKIQECESCGQRFSNEPTAEKIRNFI